MRLQDEEDVNSAAFSAKGESAVVIGNEGSVFMMTDGGEHWDYTEGLDPNSPLSAVSASRSGGFIGWTENEKYYRLRAHPELEGWSDWSIADIRRKMEEDKHLRDSRIFQEISSFDDKPAASGAKGSKNSKGFWGGLDDLTVMRIVTMDGPCFFLVQILVRPLSV